jgi:predicted enzyme related to lactoylglutathione lyase
MLKLNYLEFNVPDTKQAAKFFKTVFGWDAQGWGDSDYLVADNGEGPGASAGIDKVKEGKQPNTVAVVTVDSVDEAVKTIVAAGGKIVTEKFAVGEEGHAAYFTTPGGLMMSVYEANEKAV